MDKKDKENRLLATAFDLFTKKGVNNTSIQDIADSAGVLFTCTLKINMILEIK